MPQAEEVSDLGLCVRLKRTVVPAIHWGVGLLQSPTPFCQTG